MEQKCYNYKVFRNDTYVFRGSKDSCERFVADDRKRGIWERTYRIVPDPYLVSDYN